MNNKIVVSIVAVLLLVNLSLIGFLTLNQQGYQRTGYVHNDRLILEFKGFKESQAEYQAMTNLMQSNLDTLSVQFNNEVEGYFSQKESLSKKERAVHEERLKQREAEVIQYKKAIEQKAVEKEVSMNASVFKQINSLVKEYAIENNYDVIIGVTESGNVLYAKESKDITDQVIRYINQKYEGK